MKQLKKYPPIQRYVLTCIHQSIHPQPTHTSVSNDRRTDRWDGHRRRGNGPAGYPDSPSLWWSDGSLDTLSFSSSTKVSLESSRTPAFPTPSPSLLSIVVPLTLWMSPFSAPAWGPCAPRSRCSLRDSTTPRTTAEKHTDEGGTAPGGTPRLLDRFVDL